MRRKKARHPAQDPDQDSANVSVRKEWALIAAVATQKKYRKRWRKTAANTAVTALAESTWALPLGPLAAAASAGATANGLIWLGIFGALRYKMVRGDDHSFMPNASVAEGVGKDLHEMLLRNYVAKTATSTHSKHSDLEFAVFKELMERHVLNAIFVVRNVPRVLAHKYLQLSATIASAPVVSILASGATIGEGALLTSVSVAAIGGSFAYAEVKSKQQYHLTVAENDGHLNTRRALDNMAPGKVLYASAYDRDAELMGEYLRPNAERLKAHSDVATGRMQLNNAPGLFALAAASIPWLAQFSGWIDVNPVVLFSLSVQNLGLNGVVQEISNHRALLKTHAHSAQAINKVLEGDLEVIRALELEVGERARSRERSVEQNKEPEQPLQQEELLELDSSQPIAITFKDVEKCYKDRAIWLDCEMYISGGILTIAGANGSGKSTFISLLQGVIDPDGGEILINGVPRSRYDPKSLQSLFAPVGLDVINTFSTGEQLLRFSYSGEEQEFFDKAREAFIYAGLIKRGLSADRQNEQCKFWLQKRFSYQVAQGVLTKAKRCEWQWLAQLLLIER